MASKRDLRPVQAGVIYSPGGSGWVFYPEERLFVGTTGTKDCPTHVRSMLTFPSPERGLGEVLIEAELRLRLVQYDAEAAEVVICLREPPAGEWTVDAELDQPVLAEVRLGPLSRNIRLNLTAVAAAWAGGEPNRGVVLNSAEPFSGVVGFAAGRTVKPPPLLRLRYHPPARPGQDAREDRN